MILKGATLMPNSIEERLDILAKRLDDLVTISLEQNKMFIEMLEDLRALRKALKIPQKEV
jgi:hypothetical protein